VRNHGSKSFLDFFKKGLDKTGCLYYNKLQKETRKPIDSWRNTEFYRATLQKPYSRAGFLKGSFPASLPKKIKANNKSPIPKKFQKTT
jgi:hypothetical protein